ncbi:kelch repeat-containing protein [Aliiglaciecola sp. 2_MG-2023]|uniref:Kelch repeat-containing protein n=1 Tax=unclassified Aliiglaciecola TaxID=2593648 RepID=UPI0026E40934|nr:MULTISPECIES: kelch motif-containing protein [unclassified Aliiglaciecola]MDO6712402.1 kelch repeat-containing protein [Aliiglaciecola sp. 2_MG-2023]MDO6753396.1 kelch repeat-containing protein [Aliiglaciecola sp. 1_MG-2023]
MLTLFNPKRLIVGLLYACSVMAFAAQQTWDQVETNGTFSVRHEAGFVQLNNKGYLIGGRGIKSVDELEPSNLNWRNLSPSPLELHHFQPVVWQDQILIAGALTGQYPDEKPVAHIYFFSPHKNAWQQGTAIPKERLRGSAIAVVNQDILYLIGGITNGHLDGNVSWVDSLDLRTQKWSILPNAPHSRDHAQGVLIDNKIYVIGGRRTLGAQNKVFELVEEKVDVFDIASQTWSTLPQALPIPRAGLSVYAEHNSFIAVGGESANPNKAHEEVHRYDILQGQWSSAPSLIQGRHGSGVIKMNGYLWIASGSGMQGGSPELDSVERILADDMFK